MPHCTDLNSKTTSYFTSGIHKLIYIVIKTINSGNFDSKN